MIQQLIKELNIEPYTKPLTDVATLLDDLEFQKVKTKYAKGGWDAISLHGYGSKLTDILKPGVLKSSVKTEEKLQWTSLKDNDVMKPVLEILDKLPCEYERVRFMKLKASKIIGKHTDKIDKEIQDGTITRIHIPIRTNENVVFTIYENTKDSTGIEHRLKTGHFYYTDVAKPHAVRNESDIDRIHLVVDCYANSALRTLIA